MLVTKTIRAELFGLTQSKLEKLEELAREWDGALGLERGYKTLRGATSLPSYYCRALSWKVKGKSPVLLDKDAFRLKDTGNKFSRFFISIPTPHGRVWCPLRMWKRHEELLLAGELKSRIQCWSKRGAGFTSTWWSRRRSS